MKKTAELAPKIKHEVDVQVKVVSDVKTGLQFDTSTYRDGDEEASTIDVCFTEPLEFSNERSDNFSIKSNNLIYLIQHLTKVHLELQKAQGN